MGQPFPSRMHDSSRNEHPLWMALFGCLLGLSAPGYGFWCLAWVAFIPALLWAYHCQNLKKKLMGGFLFGFCFQALYCLWFFDLHPLTWLGFDEISSRVVTLAGWLLIGLEGGLLTSVFFSLCQAKTPHFVRIAGFPVLWISLFLLLNLTPLALPWGLLEYTQASVPSMRWLAGTTGSGLAITGLILLHNTLWAEVPRWLQSRNNAVKKPLWLLAGCFIFPGFLCGIVNPSPAPKYPLPVAIIQANLPIELIRSGRLSEREIEPAYLSPIRKTHFLTGTLVLLPEEGVVPGLVPLETPDKNRFFQTLRKLATQKNIYIAVGVSTLNHSQSLYNSIALISPTPTLPVAFYNKRRLVPFGEYTPYELGTRLTRLLNAFQVDYSAPYAAGYSEAPLLAGHHPVGGLLCFELIDSLYAHRYQKRGVSLLINLSNLGWFHQNPLIESQFLAIGQIRAAETGIPLAIASNTGISAILSGSGEILKRTQPKSSSAGQNAQIIFYP